MARKLILTLLGAATLLSACHASEPAVSVLQRYPHQTDAFTQGLVYEDGRLFESTGLRGQSSLREVELETGRVLRQINLADRYFGEGLALVGDTLVMLTWQEGEAFTFDRDTFEQTGSFEYDGEGWGLCHDGRHLVMSNGSSVLQYRDPATFEVDFEVSVTLGDGTPVPRLNELECVGQDVWANVFMSTYVVRIKQDGEVGAVFDLANLLTADEWAELGPEAVLNGIAWRQDTGTFLFTGKLWPWIFELRID